MFRLELKIKRTNTYTNGEDNDEALQAGGSMSQWYRVGMQRTDSKSCGQSSLPEAQSVHVLEVAKIYMSMQKNDCCLKIMIPLVMQ